MAKEEGGIDNLQCTCKSTTIHLYTSSRGGGEYIVSYFFTLEKGHAYKDILDHFFILTYTNNVIIIPS